MRLFRILSFLFRQLFFRPLFAAFNVVAHLLINRNRSLTRTIRDIDPPDPIYYTRRPPSNAIRLVWCDPSTQTKDAIEHSLRKIDPDLIIFSDSASCMTTIKKLHHEECKSVFLILSDSSAKEVLAKITPEAHSIFIFSSDKTNCTNLADQPKVNSISDSSSDLIDNVVNAWNTVEHGYIKEDEQESLRNLSKETASFLWFHMFRNVVSRLHKSDRAKNDMMHCLEEYFSNNDAQLKRVQTFARTYQSDDVFWWYAQPNFISDVINKALRSLDLDALFDLRYFIVDLCHLLQKNRRSGTKLWVYRGVLMERNKFEMMRSSMNRKDLISMRGFLSTSYLPGIAEMFCCNSNNDPNKVEIIYKIYVGSYLKHIVCADLNESSPFPEEKEILFDLDSTFEFMCIVPDEKKNDRYIIKLRATDRGGFLAEKYVSFNNQELVKQSPELLFGELLIEMGDYHKAISYFQRLLNRPNDQLQDGTFVLTRTTRSIVLNNIGHAWYKKGDFNKAMQYFDEALVLQQAEPMLTNLVGESMNNKGVILMENGKYESALEEFQKAIDITTTNNINNKLSYILRNMGTIKDILGEYVEALNLYQRAGEALLAEGVHEGHQDIAGIKMNIAFVYMNQARWSEAEKTLIEAKQIYEHILPGTHQDIARVLFTIGINLRSQKRYNEAFDHMRRALIIYEKVYGQTHPHIANTYNSMANIKSVQYQFTEALPLYEQAYKQFRLLYDTDNHPNIGRVLNNMGQAHRSLDHLPEALEYLGKALLIRQTTLSVNHPDTATTLVNISLVYQTQGDLITALEYARRGLTIRRDKLPADNEDLLETEDLVIQLERKVSVSVDSEMSRQTDVESENVGKFN